MKKILTQYDEDAQEFVEKLPKEEQKAMKIVLDRFDKQHHKKETKFSKEKARVLVISKAVARLEVSGEAEDRKLETLRTRLKQIREKKKQDSFRYAEQVDALETQIRLLRDS